VYNYTPKHSGDDFQPLTYKEMMSLSKNDRPYVHLAKNFILNEVLSKDGAKIEENQYYNTIRLMDQFQAVRNFVNSGLMQKELEMHIHYMRNNSVTRSPKHNVEVGGVDNSTHTYGGGGDCTMDGLTVKELYKVFEYLIQKGIIPKGELILYETHVHYALPKKYIIGWKDAA